MLISFAPHVRPLEPEVVDLLKHLRQFVGVSTSVHTVRQGKRDCVEMYLSGELGNLSSESLRAWPGVQGVVPFVDAYRLIGRHSAELPTLGFVYNGVAFDDRSVHVFPGLCAVDNPTNVEAMMRCLRGHGIVTTRMGAYKPRTNPYDFQGRGRDCLPYVFELAGKYGIRVIAMEVLTEAHIQEIRSALELAGNPTGVMLQIGTRNAQNFELLKVVGQQQDFPVLYKRGMGITLAESLNACEYIASGGNRRIIFCLRGVKTHLGEPHRNFVDFAHVPVVKRLTRLLVCVDPSHSVGRRDVAADGITDIRHATAQGVIAGADMVIVDFHPEPALALCDAQQALTPDELSIFLADVEVTRRAYEQRRTLHRSKPKATQPVVMHAGD